MCQGIHVEEKPKITKNIPEEHGQVTEALEANGNCGTTQKPHSLLFPSFILVSCSSSLDSYI
jgi:hypothetical protein